MKVPMKNSLQILLMALALSLCALCTWQWYGQVQQRKQLTALTQANYDLTATIRDDTRSIGAADKQIAQMDARITELKETLKTDDAELARLRLENKQLSAQQERYSNAVGALQASVKQANENIQKQNEAIKGLVADRDSLVSRLNDSIKERNEVVAKQNEAMKDLAADRDDLVSRLNDSIKERNEIVVKFNALVKQMEAMQAAQPQKESPP